MPDRLTIQRPEEADARRRYPGTLKFRVVQILVLVVAVLFADATMMEGRIRREIVRGMSGALAGSFDSARELLETR